MNNYEYDVPKFAKIVKNIDTGELYSKFQVIDPESLRRILKELGWFEPPTDISFPDFVLQSKYPYASSGRYSRYKVIHFYVGYNNEYMVALGSYEDKGGVWIDNVKYLKPKQVSMIRWIKVDKTTITIKMKIPVEAVVTLTI